MLTEAAPRLAFLKDHVMHKDQIKGAAKDVAGSIKQAAGKATGDERLQAEGTADKVTGKIQQGVGNLKDAARDALKN